MAGALTGIPVIWHQRNLIIDELIDPDRILSFLPDRIICNSRSVAKRFSRRGVVPPKVRVIYNGVDTGIFNPDITGAKVRDEFGIRPDELVVTIASRFDRRKGHDSFFKAADIISKRMPETAKRLRFLVVGGVVSGEDNPISSILKKTAEDLKMGDKILFTGFREDMPAIYAASDIVVLPSHAEACSRVVLEAMACARPVVAADEGGTPEMVADNDTGFLVPVERPEALAEKIIILARDRALAARMGEAGRERVKKNFSIEKNVKETEEIYRELAANRREN